jgi:hypothetical protein
LLGETEPEGEERDEEQVSSLRSLVLLIRDGLFLVICHSPKTVDKNQKVGVPTFSRALGRAL